MGSVSADIPSLERLALSHDRRTAVKEIFSPGTQERAFFEVLHALLDKDFTAARRLLAAADTTLFPREREQLEALMHLQAWNDSASPDSHAALQQLLTKKLEEAGYNYQAYPNYVPTAPPEQDDFEQVGDIVFPCAVSEEEYSMQEVVKKLQEHGVDHDSTPLAAVQLVFPHLTHDMQVQILQNQRDLVAVLPGLEGVLIRWMDESAEAAGTWLQQHTDWLTAEQLQHLLSSAPAVQRDPRLQRLIQAALVKKLFSATGWLELKHEPEQVAVLLDKTEQLCVQMGPSADWIRVQVQATRLQLLYKLGHPLPLLSLVQFLEMAKKIVWMSPPILTVSPHGQEIHTGVTCDRCSVNPIVGVRYKSQSRQDYDVCANCYPYAADAGPFTVISGSTYKDHIFLDFNFNLHRAIEMPSSPTDLLLTVATWLKEAVLRDGTGFFTQPHNPLSALMSPEVYNKTVAEALLISGKAENEEYWSRMYEAAGGSVKELVERQELEFLPSSEKTYKVADTVNIQLSVKNIPSVLIKVYEINGWNYFTRERTELDPSLQLVGISPTVEKVFTFNTPPLRREVLSWQILKGQRGIFVVDVMGAGQTRRAIIRKGHLRYLEHKGVAGHELNVFYEDWSVVKGAKVWLDGRTYEANESGDILIPYARTHERSKPMVLGDGLGAASLYKSFRHWPEKYRLVTRMYLERECVHPHEDVPLVISTTLFLYRREPVALGLVEDVALEIEVTTRGGTKSQQTVKGFQLSSSPQVVPISAPSQCCSITATLTGRVRLLARGENNETVYQDLREVERFAVDTTDESSPIYIWDVHFLGLPDGKWGLQVLGRAGEVPGHPIRMQVTLVPALGESSERYNFQFEVQTDATGAVKLGSLTNIAKVKVQPPGGSNAGVVWTPTQAKRDAALKTSISVTREWRLGIQPAPKPRFATQARHWTLPVALGGVTDSITIPRCTSQGSGDQVTLWSVTTRLGHRDFDGVITNITQQCLQVHDTSLVVGSLPAGQYLLVDLYQDERFLLHVVETSIPSDHPAWQHDIIPTKHQPLVWNPAQKLTVTAFTASATHGVNLKVEGSKYGAVKVILVFRRFMLFQKELENLRLGSSAEENDRHCDRTGAAWFMPFYPSQSEYMQGTPMPPAVQYVLLRRELSAQRPGNMLDRPSLLSAPFKVGTTTTVNRELPTDATPSTFQQSLQQQGHQAALFGASAAGPPMYACDMPFNYISGTDANFQMQKQGRAIMSQPWTSNETIPYGMCQLDFCSQAVVLGPFEVRTDGDLRIYSQQLAELGVDLSKSGYTVAIAAVIDEADGEGVTEVTTITGAIGTTSAPVRDMSLSKATEAGVQCVPVWDVSALQAGEQLAIPDMSTAKLVVYDHLTKARDLIRAILASQPVNITQQSMVYGTQPADVLLNDFSFIVEWPRLTAQQRLKHLKERWSNELDFFLYHRDREFFNSTILPTLQSKMQSELSFLDWWLIGHPDTVSFWSRPSKYATLNAVERILLAALAGPAHIQQLVHDWKQLLEPKKDPSSTARHQERKKKMVQTALLVFMPPEEEPRAQFQDAGTVVLEAAGLDPGLHGAVAFGAADISPFPPLRAAAAPPPGGANRMAFMPAARGMDRRTAQIQQQKALFKEKVVVDIWAETSYYKVKPDQEEDSSLLHGLVEVNEFWLDYAEWLSNGSQGSFLSTNLAYAGTTLTSAVMGLAVIGLPFEGSRPKAYQTTLQGSSTILHADAPIIAFHEQQLPAPNTPQRSQVVLVSQVLIDPQDPYEKDPVTNESFQKVVTPPLTVGHAYSYSVVVTNMSPSPLCVDVVVQVPQGAIQLTASGSQTSITRQLPPFSGHQHTVSFYFPHPGTFTQYPCSVLRDGLLIWTPENPLPALPVLASLPPPPPKLDTAEEFVWSKFVGTASNEDVLEYLATGDLNVAHLPDIAGRCHDKGFFLKATEHLRKRHTFTVEIWQFAVKHMDKEGLKELLPHLKKLSVDLLGDLVVDTELIRVEPRDRQYRHLEFWPVVHRLAHPMPSEGGRPSRQSVCQLLEDNDSIRQLWQQYLFFMACKAKLGPLDVLEYAQYLILQDRLNAAEELLTSFFTPEATAQLGSACAMQVDYMRAWLNVSSLSPDLSVAAGVAAKYKAMEGNLHPLWADKFRELEAMLEEVAAVAAGQPYQRRPDSKMAEVQEPMLLLKGPVDDKGCLKVAVRNITELQICAYVIDVELIFTAYPFLQINTRGFGAAGAGRQPDSNPGQLGGVSYVKSRCSWKVPVTAAATGRAERESTPAGTDVEAVSTDRVLTLQIGSMLAEAGLGSSSVMVELCAAGLTRSTVRFASNIHVELLEKQGTLQALDATTLLPLSATYVKVFARGSSMRPWLFKDGYTDRRGKFNYATIAAGVSDEQPSQFALLVASNTHGSVMLEASAPA